MPRRRGDQGEARLRPDRHEIQRIPNDAADRLAVMVGARSLETSARPRAVVTSQPLLVARPSWPYRSCTRAALLAERIRPALSRRVVKCAPVPDSQRCRTSFWPALLAYTRTLSGPIVSPIMNVEPRKPRALALGAPATRGHSKSVRDMRPASVRDGETGEETRHVSRLRPVRLCRGNGPISLF